MATYNRYAQDDIVISTDRVSTSTWSNNTNNLTTAHTASSEAVFGSPTSSGAFRLDIYNAATSSTSEEVQYSVLYGNRKGSGSLDFTNDTGSFGLGASRDIYSQYRNLVFGTELTDFTFDTTTPNDIFVINVNRSRYKQNLKPGTLNLKLTGDNGEFILTDDSITKTGSAVITNIGRQFNIVSGSNGIMQGTVLGQTTSGSYGLFYPDAGILLFNAGAISQSIGIDINRGPNTDGKNNQTFYDAISQSGHFILDSEEKITSQYYFTRVKNQEFNYTTNASFIETDGTLSFSSMNDNPRTYITTIGLYNDNNELVAVAKMSQPLSKDFTKEALIKVKLDY
tara:strand:+ start:476 stop:1492 length:1017 start_codon:yes stop_codon:yes gene_type:complete